MATELKERARYIDATKGVAILCITFLHFEDGVIPQWLNVWIGMFMITTFYFTSGWVTAIQNRVVTPKELFKKRMKQLGVPYLWFSLLILVFDAIWVLLGHMDTYTIMRDIYKTVTLRGIGTLWFLPVLMMGELIFCSIRNSKRKWLWATIGIIASIATSYLYYEIWQPMRELSTLNKIIDSPIQPIARGIMAWPLIAIGFMTYKYVWARIESKNNIFIAIMGTAILLFSMWLIIAPPFTIYYVNGILSQSLPAVGFICLFAIMGKNLFKNFFIYWGVNSLILMCTHYSIIEEIFKVIDAKVLHHAQFTGASTILYFVLTIIITYPIVYLFNGKLTFMIGK